MQEIYYMPQALSTIAFALAHSGKIDEATKLFDEAIQSAKSIDNGSERSQALST